MSSPDSTVIRAPHFWMITVARCVLPSLPLIPTTRLGRRATGHQVATSAPAHVVHDDRQLRRSATAAVLTSPSCVGLAVRHHLRRASAPPARRLTGVDRPSPPRSAPAAAPP
jgi:hypothetical protein